MSGNERDPRFLSRWLVIMFACAMAAFFIFSSLGDRGFIRLSRLARQRDELGDKVESLRKENARLSEEIGLLRSDPKTLEGLARTELGMVRPGETVYVFPYETGEKQQ